MPNHKDDSNPQLLFGMMFVATGVVASVAFGLLILCDLFLPRGWGKLLGLLVSGSAIAVCSSMLPFVMEPPHIGAKLLGVVAGFAVPLLIFLSIIARL